MAGWIYDFRQELESNIWLMPPMYHRVWQWIKYSVNHSDFGIPNKDGSTTIIKAGQRATSYRQIAKGVGYYEGKSWKEPNVKTIKSILDWMVKQKMITLEGNTEGTIITVEKWELYQKDLVKGNTKRITPSTPEKHHADTNNKGLINDELMNKKNSDNFEVYFESEPLNKVFIEFIEFRKQIKKPMSELAKTKMIKKLSEIGESDEDKIKILENSIINSWSGVFALKESKQQTKQSHKGIAPATNTISEKIEKWS